MKKENRKYLYIFVGVLLVFGFLVFSIMKNAKELEEEKSFVQKNNQKVEKVEKETERKVEKKKKPIKKTEREWVRNKDYYKSEEELDKKREILPYDKPLPPAPDSKEVAKKFIDVNQNNVRDDVEIEIVEDYGSDRDLVETLFAAARIKQYEFYLVENDLLTDENIEEALHFEDMAWACNKHYYETSKFYDLNKSETGSHYYKEMINDFQDTKKRKEKYHKYYLKLKGRVLKLEKVSNEICQNFFYETENWIVN